MKRRFLSIVILLVLTIMSASAAATATSSSLVRYVPKASKLVFGIEVPKLKTSFMFTEAMSVLRKEAKGKTILTFVLNGKSIDFERNVTSMLVAFESPIMNPQARTMPPSVVVVSGEFDRAAVIADAKKHFGDLAAVKKGELEVHAGKGLEIGFVNDSTLVLVDQGKFADAAWKAAADEAESGAKNANLSEMMGLVDTTEGFWLTVLTKGVKPPAAAMAQMPEAPPEMDGAAISLALASGLSATFKSQFVKPADAKRALEQFQALKSGSGDDPLVDMVGAKPLVQNMKGTVENQRVLALTTSMTGKELKTLFDRVKALAEEPPPKIGGKTGAPGEKKGPDAAPKTPPPTGSGVNADFN